MRRTMLAVLASLLASAIAPALATAAPTVTFTPLCDSDPQFPYGVTLRLSGVAPGALFESTVTYGQGSGFGPGFLNADANGTFTFPLRNSSPLNVVTVSGYEDVDEDHTRDPGEPTFGTSFIGPCADPPVPGGSVSGSIDILLAEIPGTTPVHLSIDASSGPTGQRPTGTVRLGTAGTGTVTCVSVKGKLATLGVRFEPALQSGITAAVIDVIDWEGVPGVDDQISFKTVASAPTQCPFPISSPTLRIGTNANFTVTQAPPLPTSKDQCKDGGWRGFGRAFQNQGQCVAFVQRGPKP